ncbi:MAG TPA: site-2 protease family protein [bacterium]|nr:site-2 protease family protein [bacterium]
MQLHSEMTYWVLFIPHVLFALSLHEACHAYTAYLCGDDTAALMGRVTLNPLKHIDLIGALAFIIIGLGWAKPTPVNPLRFKHAGRDDILVSAAGPASNLATGLVLLLAILAVHAFAGAQASAGPVLAFLFIGAQLNLALCFFNLLPVPPLDGSHILMEILPRKAALKIEPVMRHGMWLLLGLVLISTWVPIFQLLVWAPADLIISNVLGHHVLLEAKNALMVFMAP